MPYPTNKDLPPAVKKKYSNHGQDAFREAFNRSVYDEGKDESSAFAIAHTAAKQAEAKKAGGKKPYVKPQKLTKRAQAFRGKNQSSRPAPPPRQRQSNIVQAMTRPAPMGGGGGDSDY